MARTRTFLAVDIGDAIRRRAVALQGELAATGADVKWVAANGMHITLLFLGELDDRDLAQVCRVTAKAAARVEGFSLTLAGVGAFPNLHRPKVLWAGATEGAEPLTALFQAIEEPLAEAGIYRKEDRPYVPHLTLGRVTDEAGSASIAAEIGKYRDWLGGTVTVEQVLVMASELRRSGPEYTVVGRAALS